MVLEHAVVGVLAPEAVYSHSSAQHHPVKFALIHALFVAGAAAAGVANWRLTENAQAAERKIAEQLAYEAGHDSLTGALNRREFDRRLTLAAGPAPAGQRRVRRAVLSRSRPVQDRQRQLRARRRRPCC